MKLCPQCAFIYEDDQRVCDMDGNDLVGAVPTLLEPNLSPPTRLIIDLTATSKNSPAELLESSPVELPSRRSRILVILLVVLATLISVFVFTQVRRSRATHVVQSSQPALSMPPDNKPQPSPTDLVSSTSSAANTLFEEPPELAQESPRTNVVATPSVTRARLSSSAVSAGPPSARPRQVILRLTNGATISADEVWERKEGVWYRQAGMVTFLKRSRVSAIEQIATPRQQTGVNNVAARSGKSDDGIAQNQLRLRRLESVETKKPSRVKGFLKWTGRILKKPFKS